MVSMSAVLGKPASRIEGREKVTGAAKYAGEYNVATLAHGFVVSSAIAKGRIKNIQTADVLAVPGVLDVLTHVHRPPLADSDEKYKDDIAPDGSPFRPLYDDQIRFSGQPIALVVAEELEIARYAARSSASNSSRSRRRAINIRIPPIRQYLPRSRWMSSSALSG